MQKKVLTSYFKGIIIEAKINFRYRLREIRRSGCGPAAVSPPFLFNRKVLLSAEKYHCSDLIPEWEGS